MGGCYELRDTDGGLIGRFSSLVEIQEAGSPFGFTGTINWIEEAESVTDGSDKP